MQTAHKSPATEAFWSYTRAFQALDASAVARHFHEPAFMITPRGIHALPDAAAVERAYQGVMSELPAQRYARTEFLSLAERELGADLTELSGTGTWMDKRGEPFMPFGFTYTLRRSADGHRIVVAIIHAAQP